jgi:hypothetical protein
MRKSCSKLRAYCSQASTLDPLTLVNKIKHSLKTNSWSQFGGNPPRTHSVGRFLDRVKLHIQVGQESDATEQLYKEIDRTI